VSSVLPLRAPIPRHVEVAGPDVNPFLPGRVLVGYEINRILPISDGPAVCYHHHRGARTLVAATPIILVDCSTISDMKINSCSPGLGQQQFVQPRREVFKLFDLLDDGGVFLFFDSGPLSPSFDCSHPCVGHWRNFRLFARRSAASSVRSTLRGDAGWHRADFAEPELLTMGLNL
jgi:hypothetical protein